MKPDINNFKEILENGALAKVTSHKKADEILNSLLESKVITTDQLQALPESPTVKDKIALAERAIKASIEAGEANSDPNTGGPNTNPPVDPEATDDDSTPPVVPPTEPETTDEVEDEHEKVEFYDNQMILSKTNAVVAGKIYVDIRLSNGEIRRISQEEAEKAITIK